MHSSDLVDDRLLPIRLRRELIEQGYNDVGIRRLVRSGVWDKARWGAYVDAQPFRALDALGRHVVVARAALRQSKAECSLAQSTALAWYWSPEYGLDLSSVHLLRHDGKAGRKEAGVHQHRGSIVDGDLRVEAGVPVVSPTRAGLELTMVASLEVALVHLNHLLHEGHTTKAELEARLQLMSDWPRTLASDIAVRLSDPRLESVLESLTYCTCYRASLPMPVPQYPIEGETGQTVARLDFAWPELRRYVECDGLIKYGKLLRPGETPSDVVFREKQREDLVRRLTGWQCMRVVWADRQNPRRLGAQLHDFLLG